MEREGLQRSWAPGRNYSLQRFLHLSHSGFDRAVNQIKPILSIAGIIYIVVVQLPLISEYRPVIIDEFLIADSSYAMASGETNVPALKAWGHVIPEFGRINFHYPPAYLYLSALAYRILGFSIVSTGVLHAVLRLLSAVCFFLLAKKSGHSTFACVMLTTVWTSFAHGPIGRPEDLAILLLVAGLLLLSGKSRTGFRLALTGMFLGMTILTHPIAVMAILPCAIIALWMNHHGNIKRVIIELWTLGVVMGIVSLLWLIWIIPYWPEFKTIFIDYVLPDAAGSSYKHSLTQFVREAVSGKWCGWAFPGLIHLYQFQYSLIPIASLVGYIVVYRMKNRLDGLVILLTVGLIPFLFARGHYYCYHMTWMSVSLVTLLGLLGTRSIVKNNGWFGGTRPIVPWFLVLMIAVQVMGHATGQAKQVANTIHLNRLGHVLPHASLLTAIPPNEKVILNDGYAFYHIRSKNPVFWPCGLKGLTTSGLPFKADYDPSFRWMILDRPLSEDKNPGLKFAWDLKSWHWFNDNFKLYRISKVDPSLAKYMRKFPERLYLYIREARMVHQGHPIKTKRY